MVEWTPEKELILMRAVAHFKPVGVNKHFNMMFLLAELTELLEEEVASEEIWAKLDTYYDLERLDYLDATQWEVVEDMEGTDMAALERVELVSDDDDVAVDFELPTKYFESLDMEEDDEDVHPGRFSPTVKDFPG